MLQSSLRSAGFMKDLMNTRSKGNGFECKALKLSIITSAREWGSGGGGEVGRGGGAWIRARIPQTRP